ncbi:cytochrome P450 [Aspergillus mulundensis]|uniref:Cytochrome P450 n=1 Tax=Aspergillus mulundensis TaxID=1810919 RepID=A0A3D8RRW3_9EURO|nr:Cytochrome P450 [Aspergillus mulundensis]RDW76745.1 Cytochrome P450 [Aspergillus mulundensis]
MGLLSSLSGLAEANLEIKTLAYCVLALLVVYWASLAVYRLYVSPLARFPGPKLAALTYWTEIYYELIHGEGGQYFYKYREWHEKYGPIVRINPRELHIQDASFFETFYMSGKPANKLKELAHRFNNQTSAISTPDHFVHRTRRNALNPFFSKRRISERVPLIKRQMDEICQRLEKEFRDTGRVLVVDDMFGCWATDIIAEYCFERQYGFIREPDFKSGFVDVMMDLVEPILWVTHFPLIIKLMQSLPDSVVSWLNPGMKNVLDFNAEMLAQVNEALGHAQETDSKGQRAETILTSIIQSDIPRSEVAPERLQHEAISLMGAGIETTMRALTLSIFHITNTPWVNQRLREELNAAIPDPANLPSWEALEQLPFLAACINESLRLSYGASGRLPRTLNEPTQYKEHIIPPGTVISMDIPSVSHDEDIFPDSHTYNPARWLDSPRAPDGRLLTRYLVSFSRGPRSCVGMQLAYAELYIGLASLIRRFDFELYETDRSDVDLARDRFIPRAKAASKGVRVLVK